MAKFNFKYLFVAFLLGLAIFKQTILNYNPQYKIYDGFQTIPDAFPKHTLMRENEDNLSHIPCEKPHYNNCVTLVTAYFLIPGSKKHTPLEFKTWMTNFLSKVTVPMVIFTEPPFVPLMTTLRNDKPTHFVTYNSLWDIPWVKESNLHTKYIDTNKRDPHNWVQTPEMYAIWNSKPWFVAETAKNLNPFNSTFFYWMDIGVLRQKNHELRNFPDVNKAIQVFGKTESDPNYKKINVFAINGFPVYNKSSLEYTYSDMIPDFVIGGFFGGTVYGVDWFAKVMYKAHDELLREKYFVGNEQDLFNYITIRNWENVLVVCSCSVKNWTYNICGDSYFYFQQWYAKPTEYTGKCKQAPVTTMKHLFEYFASSH